MMNIIPMAVRPTKPAISGARSISPPGGGGGSGDVGKVGWDVGLVEGVVGLVAVGGV